MTDAIAYDIFSGETRALPPKRDETQRGISMDQALAAAKHDALRHSEPDSAEAEARRMLRNCSYSHAHVQALSRIIELEKRLAELADLPTQLATLRARVQELELFCNPRT